MQASAAAAPTEDGGLTYKDIEEIRTLKNPPDVVRRTLEVTCLIIATSGRVPKAEPPAWTIVQRKLGDPQFFLQVLSCDPASLRAAPQILSFIAAEYFATGNAAAIAKIAAEPSPVVASRQPRVSMRDMMSRSATQGQLGNASQTQGRLFRTGWNIIGAEAQEPLKIDRVRRASATAAILLQWCAAMLEIASSPAPALDEESAGQAALDRIKAQVAGSSGSLPSLSRTKGMPKQCAESKRLPSDSLRSPRMVQKHSVIPSVPLQAAQEIQMSAGSAPSSFRQKPSMTERLQPLGNEDSRRLALGQTPASSSKSPPSVTPSFPSPGASGAARETAASVSSVSSLIDRATEKVQSLAFAKIERANHERALRAELKGKSPRVPPPPLSPRPVSKGSKAEEPARALDTAGSARPPEPQRLTVSKDEEDDVLKKARETLRRRAEEKAQVLADYNATKTLEPGGKASGETGDAAPVEVEEPPWRSWHSNYMRGDEVSSKDGPGPGDPDKVADGALKKMEKAMKAWEEDMKRTSHSDVEVVQDGNKPLEGGFLETLVTFSADSDEVAEKQEAILRTVAATVRMRVKLRLQLIGCGMELDGPVTTMRRLCNVHGFFESDGVACEAVHAVRSSNRSFIQPEWIPIATSRQPRYVLCRLHMNDDMELCGHLLGTLASSNTKTRNQAAWLKSNFEIVTY